MTNRNTALQLERFPTSRSLGRSIFPTFDVNVPMPKDTAVPGSYNKTEHHPLPGAVVAKPGKTEK